MFASKKGTKYYIHLFLYFVIIVLLSVSLTGPWIKYKSKDESASLDYQFNLFRIKVNSEINILQLVKTVFNIAVYKDDGNSNSNSNNEVKNPLRDQIIVNHFTPIKVYTDEETKNINLIEIRDQIVNTINVSDKTTYNNITYKLELKDKHYKKKVEINQISAELLKNINNLFNKSRDDDNDFFSITTTKSTEQQKEYVKSGELKDTLKDVEKYVKQFFYIIQIVMIICIVLLFLHFLLILFKGRRSGIFRFSGIITVFLPLIVLLFLAVIYILLSAGGVKGTTQYYLLYTIASMLLFITWFLGLFKII